MLSLLEEDRAQLGDSGMSVRGPALRRGDKATGVAYRWYQQYRVQHLEQTMVRKCLRCGTQYVALSNAALCTFHPGQWEYNINSSADHGRFGSLSLQNDGAGSTGVLAVGGQWNCCFNSGRHSQGCKRTLHDDGKPQY